MNYTLVPKVNGFNQRFYGQAIKSDIRIAPVIFNPISHNSGIADSKDLVLINVYCPTDPVWLCCSYFIATNFTEIQEFIVFKPQNVCRCIINGWNKQIKNTQNSA